MGRRLITVETCWRSHIWREYCQKSKFDLDRDDAQRHDGPHPTPRWCESTPSNGPPRATFATQHRCRVLHVSISRPPTKNAVQNQFNFISSTLGRNRC